MACFIDLFSPETYLAFSAFNRDITGFRERRRRTAANVRPGDKLICSMTKLTEESGLCLEQHLTARYLS